MSSVSFLCMFMKESISVRVSAVVVVFLMMELASFGNDTQQISS